MLDTSSIVVVGAGVIGLTTALYMAEHGLSARVYTSDAVDETTSAAAAATWSPYAGIDERTPRWSTETLHALTRITNESKESGVRFTPGVEASRSHLEVPDWARRRTGFRVARTEELPAHFVSGWWCEIPIIYMPTYLLYLRRRLDDLGIPVVRRTVESLDVVLREADVVVNCTGMAARTLADDDEMVPVRGEVVITTNPGIDHFFLEHGVEAELAYIVPHGDRVVLGGSAEVGREDKAADPAMRASILERCSLLEPLLRSARVLDHRVGIRPVRPSVRLEVEERPEGVIVHNYGHGGIGVTLSWGCAAEATRHAVNHARGGTGGRW